MIQYLSTDTLNIADGVNPPYVSENVHKKFTGPFSRIVMPGVGHFPSREAPDLLATYLLNFLADKPVSE